MKRIWWITATIAMLAVIGGCKNNGHNQNSTDMRVLNAVVDAEPLDVLIDDDVKQASVAFAAATSYAEFDSGSRDTKVRSTSQGTILAEKTVAYNSGVHSTLVLYGKRSSIGTLQLIDDATSPSSGKFKLRVADLSPEAGAIDLYITNTGDITSVPASMVNVGYGAVTDFSEFVPGSYRLTFATAGTKDVLFQSAAQTFAEGGISTLTVFPAIGGKLVNAELLTSAGGTYLPNPFGRLKAVNAVPDSPALNFKADGATLLSSVPFGGSSSYVTINAGARSLTLEAANVPGTALATLAKTIDPARDYTTIAVNNLGQAALAAFVDDNTLPAAGFAKVRFGNAMVGSTTVDALVNFASQASGIPYPGVSSYYQLAASTTYTLTFATPGGVSVITTLSPVEIDAGAVYTVYLMGTAAAPVAKLVRDR
jgi:Domain of unknown function (DUF4397)